MPVGNQKNQNVTSNLESAQNVDHFSCFTFWNRCSLRKSKNDPQNNSCSYWLLYLEIHVFLFFIFLCGEFFIFRISQVHYHWYSTAHKFTEQYTTKTWGKVRSRRGETADIRRGPDISDCKLALCLGFCSDVREGKLYCERLRLSWR